MNKVEIYIDEDEWYPVLSVGEVGYSTIRGLISEDDLSFVKTADEMFAKSQVILEKAVKEYSAAALKETGDE